jgi:hypothetical protein
MDGGDIGMLQRRQELRFALKTRQVPCDTVIHDAGRGVTIQLHGIIGGIR